MTHLPDITPEQALAVLLKGAKLQQGPTSRTPLLEAVIGIGKDHHAYIGLYNKRIAKSCSCNLLFYIRKCSSGLYINCFWIRTFRQLFIHFLLSFSFKSPKS